MTDRTIYPLPECRTTIEPSDVEWEMDWTQKRADGSRMCPDKPEKERIFEPKGALALMLINEVIFLNSHHWEKDWPEAARQCVSLNVNCSDVFAWACADSEEATYAEIEAVYQHWKKDTGWGTAIWCIIKRKELPQRPVEKRIRDDGIWDLDALTKEHGLRANHYDGISGLMSRRKYAAYSAWAKTEGREVLPYDAGWWAGWKQFTAANPGWNSAEWKAAEDAAIAEWRLANGWAEDADS